MKKTPSLLIPLLIVLFVVTTISSAAAVTITVDDNIEGADCNTIQHAVENATDGDTVLVFPGSYTENVYVDKELIISSFSGNPVDTVVQAANSEDDVFKVVSDNVTISGFSITGAGIDQYGDDRAGIYFESVNNSVIRENNVYSNGYGISLLNSNNNILADNNAYMSGIGGIFLWNSSHNRLHNNLINTSNHEGIHLYESSNNNELNDNTVNSTYAGFGIDLTLCYNNILTNNIVANNELGFLLTGSNNNTFINNIANSNSWSGIDLQGSNSNIFCNNKANFNSHNGILLINSNSNRLDYNNVSNNAEYGINLNNFSTGNILTGNIADSNGVKNIHIVDPANNTINTDISPEVGSAQKLLFEGFTLSFIMIITAALITGRRMRED